MWCRCELGPEQLTLAFTSPFCSVSFQEAQVTIECTILQKFHRSIMGPKGSKIQQITRDYNVQIKFPDREENPGGSWLSGGFQRLRAPGLSEWALSWSQGDDGPFRRPQGSPLLVTSPGRAEHP